MNLTETIEITSVSETPLESRRIETLLNRVDAQINSAQAQDTKQERNSRKGQNFNKQNNQFQNATVVEDVVLQKQYAEVS